MAHITKIEVYPQIFLYEKDYLDARLDGLTIPMIKGRFFGFNKDTTPSFSDKSMNPLNPPVNGLKFEIFSGQDHSSSIDINITYQQFVESFLFDQDVVTAMGTNRYKLGSIASLDWMTFSITCADGNREFVAPAPSSLHVMLPIRVRFFYVITYVSGEQEIVMAFPHQVNGFYETVFNADQPYRFLGTTKEYATNEWRVFDISGNEIAVAPGTNPASYTITPNSNGAYLLMKESIIGCFDDELMREKAMVDSRLMSGGRVLEEFSDGGRLPNTVASLLIPDWTFSYNDEDAKPTDGQNVYDIKSSFIRRRCYFIPFAQGQTLINAKFIDVRTNEEYPVNGLIDASLVFSSSEPIIEARESVFASLSDTIHSVMLTIDCSNTMFNFTGIQRSILYRLKSRDTLNNWTARTVTAPVSPEPSFDIASGSVYLDRIFDILSKLDLESMCNLSADSTTAWIGEITVQYSGMFNSVPLTLIQKFNFMLGIDNCISVSSASINVTGGSWKSSNMKIIIGMPSSESIATKSAILSRLLIPAGGLALKYSGALAGIIKNSTSPVKQFTGTFAYVSYGTNMAVIDFSGGLAIVNNIGSPIYLVNGAAFLHAIINDAQNNSTEIAYGTEIPITGGDMNYTVSNPPDITEIDPKVETLISKI